MEPQAILKTVDHTLLTQTATWDAVQALCDEGLEYGTASVCIPPCFVRRAAAYLRGRLPICTVIGFPNGYATPESKCFETSDAILNGAAEIDMVANLGLIKAQQWEALLDEIASVRRFCEGRTLKVIVETALLTQAEKIHLCDLVAQAGADYIKTSTGFAGGGATFADVELLARHVPPGLKIKASGGIRTLEDAERFLALGASRIGASRLVSEARQQQC